MSVQEAIIKAQAALDELRDGTYTIISRPEPATWGELRETLQAGLENLRRRGLDFTPPEVVLPDGVTSTSEVTQTEMTQFVTNTLNVWFYSIIDLVKKNTIYTMQPTIVTYKYVPRVIPIKIVAPTTLTYEPALSVSKTGFITRSITAAADPGITPVITAAKEV